MTNDVQEPDATPEATQEESLFEAPPMGEQERMVEALSLIHI